MKNYHRQLLFIGLYALIALIMTWPIIAHFTTGIAGQGGDPYQTLWRFDEKLSSFDWREEFLGQGEPRLVNLTVWPWIWAHVLFGEPVGYNLAWLLSFILAGVGMYALTGELVRQYGAAAFLSGLMFMLLPFHVGHSFGHFGAMQVHWLPLVLWAFLRWYKSGDIRWGALTGLLLVIQAFSEHHYFLWLVVFGLVALLYFRTLPKQWLGVGVIVGVLVLLSYWPTVRLALQSSNNLELGIDQTIRFSADALSYLTPASFHSIWGGWTHSLLGWRFGGNITEATQFVGWVPLLLILFFHQQIPGRQKKFLVMVAIVFFTLGLGPVLKVGGWVSGLPLPYTLVDWLPGVAAVRAVGRAGAMVGLALSILFGWVVHTQVQRPRTVGLLAGLLVLELSFAPMPTQSMQLSPAYQFVQTLPGRAVVEIPAATNYTVASRALLASHVHGKDIVANIALERGEDPEARDVAKVLPGVKQLLYLRTTDLLENRREFFGQDVVETLPDALHWLDVSAIIVNGDSLSSLQLTALQNLLEKQLKWRSESFGDVVVYPVPGTVRGDGIILRRGEGWEAVTYDREKNMTVAAYKRRAEVILVNTTDRTKRVSLLYTEANKNQATTVTVPPGETVYTFTSRDERTVIINPAYAIAAD